MTKTKQEAAADQALRIAQAMQVAQEHGWHPPGEWTRTQGELAVMRAALEECLDILEVEIQAFRGQLTINPPEDAEVRRVCERWGYGATIAAAARLWYRRYEEDNPARTGVFTGGTCISLAEGAAKKARAALSENVGQWHSPEKWAELVEQLNNARQDKEYLERVRRELDEIAERHFTQRREAENRVIALETAMERLLNCPALNEDEREHETWEAIIQARIALGLA